MYHRPPRIVLGALAFSLLALVTSLKAPPSPSTVRTSALVTASAPRTPDLSSFKALDQQSVSAWEVAVAQAQPPVTEPPPTVPEAKVATPTTAPAEEAPPPDPQPVSEPSGSSAEDAVRQFFPDVFDKAWRVAGCESSHDPSRVSPGGANWGLFQINTVHRDDFESFTGQPWDSVLDPWFNSMYARKLYDGSGWGPWTCKYA